MGVTIICCAHVGEVILPRGPTVKFCPITETLAIEDLCIFMATSQHERVAACIQSVVV